MNERLSTNQGQVDIELMEETAIALAQSTLCNAMERAGISKSDLARRMGCNRSLVTRILTGSHNLTVRTMARALAVCGFEARFESVPIVWDWKSEPLKHANECLPASAGSAKAACYEAALVVPAYA